MSFSSNFAGLWIDTDNPLIPAAMSHKPQSLRANVTSHLLHQVCKFWQLLKHQEIPPFVDSQGHAFTMNQFRNLFNTSRIPRNGEDCLDIHFRTEDEAEACPNHVVVLCNGHFYSIGSLEHPDGSLATPAEIEAALRKIETESQEKEQGIGPLSCLDRESWARHYAALQQSNPIEMELLSSAICLVILSDQEPQNHGEQLKSTYFNDGQNVWTDKSLTFVAFKNGAIGSQSEVVRLF